MTWIGKKQVELSFSREQCRELQLQVVEALHRAPERYWEHAVEDGRNPS